MPSNPVVNRALEVARRLTLVQRILIGAGIVTACVGVFLIFGRASNPNMSVLFTDLKAKDASSITTELQSQGIKYQLKNNGATIEVPADKVYQLRIDMAGKGLPAASDGYALLDKQGITTSEFKQHVDYQRALEGEIASTVAAIDGVQTAVVHLALPAESVFVDKPGTPTASVLVKMSGAATLDSDQVAGIKQLVAASVKGMKAENVSVTDSSGKVLDAAGTGAGATNKASNAYEQQMQDSITQLVGRVVGGDKVQVSVSAKLNMDQTDRTTEKFTRPQDSRDGVDGLVTKDKSVIEDYQGADAGQTGVLGPDGAPVTGTGGNVTYKKDDTGRDISVDRTVEATKVAPGGVERLSVAVVLDDAAVTEAQATQVAQLVQAAAGVDVTRGDTVVVSRLPFNTTAADDLAKSQADAQAAASQQALFGMIRTGLLLLLACVGLFLAYRSVRKARQVVVEEITTRDLDPLVRRETVMVEVPVAVSDPMSLDLSADDALRVEVQEFTDERPDQVASLLRTWINER